MKASQCFVVLLLLFPATAIAGITYSYSGSWREYDLGLPDQWGNRFEGTITTIYSVPSDLSPQIILTNNGIQDLGSGQFYTEYTGFVYDSYFDITFVFDVPAPGEGSSLKKYSTATDFTLTGTTIDPSGKYILNLTGLGTNDGYSTIPDDYFNMLYYYGTIHGDITINWVPVPGALVLGSLGIGLVGAIRRRLA